MFYEIRHYQTEPGRRDEWVRYMEDVVIPYQQSKGMTVTASFVDDEDPDGYVWIRRFDDEANRAALYAATHDDPGGPTRSTPPSPACCGWTAPSSPAPSPPPPRPCAERRLAGTARVGSGQAACRARAGSLRTPGPE